MTAVKMHIDKFDGEVIIDENHPLAIAQREKDAKAPKSSRAARSTPAAVPEGAAPAVQGEGAAEPAAEPAKPKRSRKRASR